MLNAAAALFCTVGFTSTSTRAIADARRVRQASIYHHFAGKDAILLELLLGAGASVAELADALAAGAGPAAARLWALVDADGRLLCAGPVNDVCACSPRWRGSSSPSSRRRYDPG